MKIGYEPANILEIETRMNEQAGRRRTWLDGKQLAEPRTRVMCRWSFRRLIPALGSWSCRLRRFGGVHRALGRCARRLPRDRINLRLDPMILDSLDPDRLKRAVPTCSVISTISTWRASIRWSHSSVKWKPAVGRYGAALRAKTV